MNDEQEVSSKSNRITCTRLMTGASFLIALSALFVAIIALIHPFEPVGPSPLSKPLPPESRIQCKGKDISYSDFQWQAKDEVLCQFTLEEGEAVAGIALELVDDSLSYKCILFAFGGISHISNLSMIDTSFSLYSNVADTFIYTKLMEGKINDLLGVFPECSDMPITQIAFPRLLSIPGFSEEGVDFYAPLSGNYKIQLVGGSYSSYPVGHEYNNWRTKVNIYVDRPIEWGERLRKHENDDPNLFYEEPVNPDFSIGNEEIRSKEFAESAGTTSPPISINLSAGQNLIFVPIDDKGWYNRPQLNPGEVILLISFYR